MTEAYDDGDRQKFAIISTTSTGVITSFSRAAEELLGLRAEQAVGELIPVCVPDRSDPSHRSMTLASVGPTGIKRGIPCDCRRSRGRSPVRGRMGVR
jgi:PAS domain S-box-containing protein